MPLASAGTDFYKVLGVDRGVDDRTLKKVYRKLALQHHPDKGGDEEKFREISSAYDVLSGESINGVGFSLFRSFIHAADMQVGWPTQCLSYGILLCLFQNRSAETRGL